MVIQRAAGGRFVQVDQTTWFEPKREGGEFVFEEYGRDEWSVYLYDWDRGMRVQLDLWRDMVSYSWETSGPMTDLYGVTGAR